MEAGIIKPTVTILIDAHYLPCIAWFSLLTDADKVILEKHEHYVKQSYRTRTHINTEHGRDVLTVPVRSGEGKIAVKDVRIDYTQKWVNHHWRTIQSAYGKAPFFEYYSDDLKTVLYSGIPFLFDLNSQLLTMCLKWLKHNVMIEETLSYEKSYAIDVHDCRNFVNAKNQANVRSIFRPEPYHQVFGNAFAENLSIIDLIFCCGPEAGSILRSSTRKQ